MVKNDKTKATQNNHVNFFVLNKNTSNKISKENNPKTSHSITLMIVYKKPISLVKTENVR